MARKPMTFESNLDYVMKRVHNAPSKVMGTIGQQIVREVKSTTLKAQYNTRYKMMAKALQYAYGYDRDARKRELHTVKIGFKLAIDKNPYGAYPAFVGGILTGSEPDPIKPVVIKNNELIQSLIGVAMAELNSKR